MSGIKCAVN